MTYMTRMKGTNNLKIRRAAIRNGCKLKKEIIRLQIGTEKSPN